MSQPVEHIANSAGMPNALEQRILLLAPAREDAEMCQRVLGEAGIGVAVCADLPQIFRELLAGAAALLLTEEALIPGQMGELKAALAVEPQWSDLPVLVLTQGGAELPLATRVMQHLDNAVLMERPVQPLTLLSVVRSAVKHHHQQYQLRKHLIEQEQAREALKQSEERFRLMVEAVNDYAIFMLDREGHVATWNAGAQRIKGYAAGEILGEHFSRFYTPEDVAADKPSRELALAAEQGQCMDEGWRVRKDGSRFWASVTITAVRDASGELRGFAKVTRDMTDRRLAEESLRASERELRFVCESIPHMVWAARPDGYVDYFNQRVLDYTGARHEEMIGWDWLACIHPEDRQQATERWTSALRGGSEFRTDYRMRQGQTGQYRWHTAHAMPQRDGNGRIIRWYGTCTDIDEQKRSEERLEQRVRQRTASLAKALAEAEQGRATLDALLESIPEGITIVDAENYRLRRASRYMGQMLGVDIRTLENMTATEYLKRCEILEADGVTPVRLEDLPLVQAIRDGRTIEGRELVVRRGTDGAKIPILSNAAPIRDSSGQITGGVAAWRDITERKRAEEALERHAEALAAAQRSAERAKAAAEEANQAKDHFLAVLSHELRTPLTPVLPALEELARLVPEESREDVEVVQRNVELEARLIDDLLDVTRISRGKIELHCEPVELCTIVRRAAEVCAPDIEARRLPFAINIEGGPYPVEADPARLQQVFWNLLKNAIKFTPHGGCVGVRCFGDGDGHVLVEVADSGMGIEPEALARIFTAFEQVDRSVTRQFGGLGLGLAISKALVEMHGGTIAARSEGKGKGATFTVRLPIHKAAEGKALSPEPRQRAAATHAPAPARPLAILLVEDHGDTARIMRRMLQNRGHRVETAGDVATALELAREKPFDLVLSDLGLPDRSGLELMQELRRMGRDISGIALSGYGREEDVRRSREAGFGEHLTKPINFGQLEAAIARVAMARG